MTCGGLGRDVGQYANGAIQSQPKPAAWVCPGNGIYHRVGPSLGIW